MKAIKLTANILAITISVTIIILLAICIVGAVQSIIEIKGGALSGGEPDASMGTAVLLGNMFGGLILAFAVILLIGASLGTIFNGFILFFAIKSLLEKKKGFEITLLVLISIQTFVIMLLSLLHFAIFIAFLLHVLVIVFLSIWLSKYNKVKTQ